MTIMGNRNKKFGAAFLPIIIILIAACGGAVSAVATDDGITNTSLEAPAVEATTAPATSAASSSLASTLDADAIVAAQGEVLNRIYEDLLPSVVHIQVSQRVDSSGQGRQFQSPFGSDGFPGAPQTPPDLLRQGEGSGFVWSDEGYIVTNHHVIDDADRVTVIFADGTQVEAEVLGSDPDSDLAVLKVNMEAGHLRAVTLGDSDAAKVGELVAAIGNPFGQDFTLTTGIVSAVGRTIQSGNSQFSVPEVIQTDAAISPGNSGGPLLDRMGRVIGINTQIISRGGGNAGIGFAVPINTAKQVIPVLIDQGRYEYAWLGISGAQLTQDIAEARGLPVDTRGVLVIEATQGGPADEAGLEGIEGTRNVDGIQIPEDGDVIVGIDGTTVDDMDDLIVYLIENTRPGDTVILDVIRDGGQTDQIEVTLGTRPASDN